MQRYDVAVIGGGIVGLAAARAVLTTLPHARLLVLEKESQLAAHQTGHNSGVIHSGIYYRTGSLKAAACVAGAVRMMEFCRQYGIPSVACGKLIVAVDESEIPRLEALYQQGIANGVSGLAMLGPAQIRDIEPHATGVKAIHVPHATVVDYPAVAGALAGLIRAHGGAIWTSARVTRITRQPDGWVVESAAGEISAAYLLTCGGLHADRLAMMSGAVSDLRIVPFRGEYYDVVPERRFLVQGMIYPVPNPALPFLGVHFTRAVHGGVHAGPNAVLALKREGYRKTDFRAQDVLELLRFPGFWKMSRRYWSVGLEEMYRSWSRRVFARALQRLVPQICADDLIPGDRGVRAQAVSLQGSLVDDFSLVQGERALHVLNVPSPAATASLHIGDMIATMVSKALS